MAELMLVLLFVAPTRMLEMSVTGAGAEIPGVEEVREVEVLMPTYPEAGLSVMPGWPKSVQYSTFSPNRGVALADLNGDGRQEVIVSTYNPHRVYVWRYDGSDYPGWPNSLGTGVQYAASVGDVDGDGNLDIAVGTRVFSAGSGPVHLFDRDGNLKPGWPFRGHGGSFNSAPTLADVTGDGRLEVIVLERDWPEGYLWVVRYDGTPLPGWPCTLDHVPATSAAVADLDGDGNVEIIAASYNSLYVLQADGEMRPGWPQTMPDGRNWSYQSPALADLSGDDTLEIVTAMHQQGGGAYVFRHDGTMQTGWPRPYTRWTYCPPTVADLYRDGDLRVLCGVSGVVSGQADVLYAYDDGGSTLPGFPYRGAGGCEPNLTVADITGDGRMEVLITSNRITSADSLGYIYALRDDGSMVPGFPLRPWGFTYLNGPNVADVNGNGMMDIVAVSAHAGRMDVTIWETGVPFNRESWEWPTYQFDMARTGLYRRHTTGMAEPGERPGREQAGYAGARSVAFGSGRVRFSLPEPGPVRAEVYDPAGRRVARLYEGRLAAGEHELELPEAGGRGVRLLRLEYNGRAEVVRLVTVR